MVSKTPPVDPRDEAFLREVDDAYREDQLKQFFQRYGRLLIVLVGGGLVVVGGLLWWQADKNRRVDALSEQLTSALGQIESGSGSEAQAALEEVAQSSNNSYRALATLTGAGVALAAEDLEGAAAKFKAVADDAKAPQAIRDAAQLKYVGAMLDQLAPDEALRLLQPYLAEGNPWLPVAGELAALAQMKAGKTKEAGALFRQVATDASAPPTVRARAEQMAASLGEDMTELTRQQAAEAVSQMAGDAASAGENS